MIYNCEEYFSHFDLKGLKKLAEEWAKDYGMIFISLHESVAVNRYYDEGGIVICEVPESKKVMCSGLNQKRFFVDGVCVDKPETQLRLIVNGIDDDFPYGVSEIPSYLLFRDTSSMHWERVRANKQKLIVKTSGPQIDEIYKNMTALSPDSKPKSFQKAAKKIVAAHPKRFFMVKEEYLSNIKLFKFAKSRGPEYFRKKMLHMVIHELDFGPIEKKECLNLYNEIFNPK